MRRALGACVLAATVALIACSDSKSSTPAPAASSAAVGVDQTCRDLAVWSATAQRTFTDLQEIGQFDASDLDGAQQKLTQLRTNLLASDQETAKLIDKLEAGGPLDVSSGDEVQQGLLQALRALRQAAASAQGKLEAFDVRTATAEQQGQLKTDFEQLRTSVTESLTGLIPLLSANADLRSALQTSEACRQITQNLVVPTSSSGG